MRVGTGKPGEITRVIQGSLRRRHPRAQRALSRVGWTWSTPTRSRPRRGTPSSSVLGGADDRPRARTSVSDIQLYDATLRDGWAAAA